MHQENPFEKSFLNSNDKWLTETDKEEAIEKIMNLYGEEIKRLIFTYTRNWAQTDDIVQEVFITVFIKLDTFEGRSSLRTWIYTIAINKCKDYLKSWNFRKVSITEKWFTFAKGNVASPEMEAISHDTQSALIEKILSLPLKYREVIILFYYKELKISEICKVLNLTESTVKTRLNRGREKLKLQIDRGELYG